VKIALIGSGNTATVLGRRMITAGHEISQIYSRTLPHAERLARELGAAAVSDWKEITRKADLAVIAISDAALINASVHLKLDITPVVHTAGSVSLDVLKNVSLNYGVLYPLQSLRRELPSVVEIPFLVDGNSNASRGFFVEFAKTLSGRVSVADDLIRRKMHVAAVVVNNLTNHLYALAEEFCEKEGVDFSLLQPLIEETAFRMRQASPRLLQTGPAIRGDLDTIQKQVALLERYPYLKKAYEDLTGTMLEIYRDGNSGARS
jgi:predicted short-subunit dehydrogenase-like oxidoreductase (DUF2520 family)